MKQVEKQYDRSASDSLKLGLSLSQRFNKRFFDIVVAALGLLLLWPVIVLGWIASACSTRANGLFIHHRIGQNGKLFPMLKLRTMLTIEGLTTCVTADNDKRITRTGRILRKYKIDELPQLVNVLIGQMSLVGPRPDMPGYADQLLGDSRAILALRPGITGPASIAFRDEDELLAGVDDPEAYNDHVLWPKKVDLNLQYVRDYSFFLDLKCIWETLTGGGKVLSVRELERVYGGDKNI